MVGGIRVYRFAHIVANAQVKIGTAFRHWTMSSPAQGVYTMIKEQRVTVPVDFKAKELGMEDFVTFHKTLGVSY